MKKSKQGSASKKPKKNDRKKIIPDHTTRTPESFKAFLENYLVASAEKEVKEVSVVTFRWMGARLVGLVSLDTPPNVSRDRKIECFVLAKSPKYGEKN
ncbi:MAG: hypothetical protein GY821_02020 [Gammaproteobacteria bacterium]|nr:hypothetical protein [Gammaproteobacteria bacterium]